MVTYSAIHSSSPHSIKLSSHHQPPSGDLLCVGSDAEAEREAAAAEAAAGADADDNVGHGRHPVCVEIERPVAVAVGVEGVKRWVVVAANTVDPHAP